MTTVKDIAKILAARHSISNVEAEIFMQMIVEVINDGLLRDRQVKIKGFGSFKLQTVKERTSINVNTGERVVIGEHDKVSFTPDGVMKDLINKPFAQFQTVVVDDDSPLLDDNTNLDSNLDLEEAEDNVDIIETIHQHEDVDCMPSNPNTKRKEHEEDIQTLFQEDKKQENREEMPTNKNEQKGQLQDENNDKNALPSQRVENVINKKCSTERNNQGNIDESEENINSNILCKRAYFKCRNIFIYYGVLINVLVAAISFYIGYIASEQHWFSSEDKVVTHSVKKDIKHNIVKKLDVHKSTTNDTIDRNYNEKKQVKQKENTLREYNVKENNNIKDKRQEKSVDEESMLKRYDNDIRVRTGAYYIIGTAHEITVKKGQTLESISRAYLGEGMVCYVEVYNGVTTVKNGDKIKIPKLKLKKSVRNKK